jgi:hypothetical protein
MDIVDTIKASGRPRRVPAEYEQKLLDYYATKGNLRMAAKLAGVGLNTVARRRKTDPAFRAKLRSARLDFIASLEERLVDLGIEKGNVIAILARLKAAGDGPARRYSEKAVDNRVVNLTINQGNGEPPDAQAILGRLIGALAPAEQRALSGAEPAILEAELGETP